MTIEESFNKLKEAFGIKSAEVDAKATELTALNEKVTELTAQVGAKEATLIEMAAKVTAAEEAAKAAVAKAEALMSEKKALESTFESAAKQAAKIAASVGVEAVEVAPEGVEAKGKSNDELAQEWAALRQKDAKAASDFYTKHRTAILAAANLR
jgi:hypothetical protein